MEEKVIKAYKGFGKDMKCRDFQYEEGKEYETDKARCCNTGFHACENPIDVLNYYNPSNSIYREVECSGDIDKSNSDSKFACTKIKIGAKRDIPLLCKATFDYVKSKCTNENNAEAGKPATAGEYGAATAGNRGAATSRGSVKVGANGIGCVRGSDVKVMGGLGAVLVIAVENEDNYDIKEWKAVVVDGKRIKADTWYKLVNGEFKEVE